MAALRGLHGCPWDAEQTPETMGPYLVDEAYEVAEAVSAGEPDAVREELGDLLFLIVFLARLYQERGEFDLGDVARKAAEKMIRRHPHVFGAARVEGADQVVGRWEEIKADEDGRLGLLDGVPRGMPALARAHRLSSRAARVGFDWPGPAEVWDKVREELGEIRAAQERSRPEQVVGELGDLLFALVNLLRHLGQNAEEVLHRAGDKFQKRFEAVERRLEDQGLRPEQATAQEMNRLWDDLKRGDD
ncbi:MAG: nucleoside triphosphate pyrophosphohydrolase [Proteobacteria bacterium]|nr:nucleoside triphosphate pyrophosphohydrolase [Pseudomonadota bacterium]MBU1740489.1 nucleoside triphosphate pyrophosphohydrolase [Pseudomonadota bacterium]